MISFVILMFLSSGASASNWTQFQSNILNSGISTDKAPITEPDLNLSWDYGLPGSGGSIGSASINSPPLAVGDTVYAVTSGGTVSAINKITGVEKWNTSIGTIWYQLGAPAYGNNTIFIPTYKGDIYAIDSENGDLKWSRSAGDWIFTPVTYDENMIFFGDCNDWEGNNGQYYCYDDNGNEVWTRNSTGDGGYYWSGSCVIGNYLVFGDSEGLLTSVYKDSGIQKDEIDIASVFGISYAGSIKSSIVYNNESNRVYFTSKKSSSGYLFSIGFNTDGTFNTSEKYSASITESTSSPVVYNERVYVGSGDFASTGKMYCFNDFDLTQIWEYSPNGGVKASPVLSTAYDNGDGEVYIYFTTNDDDARVYCLRDYSNNTEPEEVWYYQPSSDINQYTVQGVAISDGWIFYGNDRGYLFGLASEDSVCIADFEASTVSGVSPLTVQFNDTSQGSISWEWDFGDGSVSYEKDPVHVYSSPGTYTVSLNVTSPAGNDIKIKENYISVWDDWNPWNDEDSEGNPDGTYITIEEVVEAYNCWRFSNTAPETGMSVTIESVVEMYNAWRFNNPM